MRIDPPPFVRTDTGETRRVGVEVEFSGPNALRSAKIVSDIFGGTRKEIVPGFVYELEGAKWGAFRVELDTQFIKPESTLGDWLLKSGLPLDRALLDLGDKLDANVRDAIGQVAEGLVPLEIVTPPIPWSELGAMTDLTEALRRIGAKGTDDHPVYGYGLHLNPEIAKPDAGYLLSVLQAYLLLSDWLRSEIQVDPTRRLLPHANAFPVGYGLKILDADYAPGLPGLIADYMEFNNTRNRELDMLPVFKHLCPDIVAEYTSDGRIQSRPTFHYRLPNALISDPGWSPVVEWNRWVVVERLACEEEDLRRLADAYLDHHNQNVMDRWLDEVSTWVRDLIDLA